MSSLNVRSFLSPSSALLAGAAVLFLTPLFGGGGDVQLPHTFQPGTKARASDVNDNFGAVADAIDALPRQSQRIVVDADGADFDSVADALDSITDAAADKPYVVWVAPGVYTETQTCVVPSFVSLVGAGAASTRITSAITANASSGASATVELEDLAGLSGLTIENTGSAAISSGVFGADLSRETRIADCVVRTTASGGLGHFAVKVEDSDVTIVDCLLQAGGASTLNSAFGSSDNGGPFAQPLLVDCVLEAKGATSGLGLQLVLTAAQVEGCRVEGGSRAISTAINGITFVRDSRIEALGLNPVYEQTGASTILSGTTLFVGGNPIGLSSQFKYAHCIKANFDPVVNGTGSSVQ